MSLRVFATPRGPRQPGFTLLEVLVSISILTIGLLGIAAMLSSLLLQGSQSRYMGMANVLASEKLDTLNKWPSSDPNVCDSTTCADAANVGYCNATSCGSITTTGACVAGDPYCDSITVSDTTGADYETQTQVVVDPTNNNPPTNVTTTIVHTSAGCVDTPANCGVANPVGGATFVRRWLISSNPTITSSSGTVTTVTGRRVTVLVSLYAQNTRNPVNFQMSMVRP